MTLNSKPSGLEHKLCNPHFPLVLTNAILSYSQGTPKIIFPASSSNHITLFHWFHFLSHQAQVVYPPFNSLPLLLTIHLRSQLLPSVNKRCQLYYLLVSSKGRGFRLCCLFGVFFFNKRNMLPLHLQKTDNDQAIGMLGCRTDTPTHIDLSH